VVAIWRVFRYEFLRHLRQRSYLFFTVGVPIIALVLYVVLTASNRNTPANAAAPIALPTPSTGINIPVESSEKIGLVDKSGLIDPAQRVTPFIRFETQEAAESAIAAGKIISFYVILPDYLETGNYELWMARFNPEGSSGSALRTVLSASLATRLGQTDPAIIRYLTMRTPDPINQRVSAGQSKESANTGVSFALVYGFALAFVFGVFFASGQLMQSVVEERENRVVEILISSMRPGQLLAGKVLSLGLLGLLQIVLWGGTAVFILGRLAAQIPGAAALVIDTSQYGLLIIYYLLGYLMFAAVYVGIGAVANNMREGPQFAAFFTLPAMLPLYFTATIAAQPDGAFATALSIFPITAPLAMIMRVSVSPVPVWQILLSMALLMMTGITFIWFAGRIFRLVIMLAGQPPTLRDIPRLIRENR
jgi:ABC-2 type transport system permease protein